MFSDRVMRFVLTIKCMERDVSIAYFIERVAHLGRLALFLNKMRICSLLSHDPEMIISYRTALKNKRTYK